MAAIRRQLETRLITLMLKIIYVLLKIAFKFILTHYFK